MRVTVFCLLILTLLRNCNTNLRTSEVFQKGKRMKTLILYTLTLMFCCIGALSVHTHEGDFHYPGVNAAPRAAQLETFHKLLKTDVDAARAELQKVASTVFGGHTLADEWVPLYFRIIREGTEHLSDIKRIHELEIRMLMAIDAEKHAEQIQYHREALKHYEELASVGGDQLPVPNKTPSDEQERSAETVQAPEVAEKPNAQIDHQHFIKFHELLPHDVEAARKELDAFAALAFHGHPRTEDWKALFFRLSRQKEATVLEIIQLLELKKQMLKDNDAERHTKEIKNLESSIKQFKSLKRTFERQGTPDQKISFNMKPGE